MVLIVVTGLPSTGRTTLAVDVGGLIGAVCLEVDDIAAVLTARPWPSQRGAAGSPNEAGDLDQHTTAGGAGTARLVRDVAVAVAFQVAGAQLSIGHRVVLTCSSSDPGTARQAMALAEQADVGLRWVETTCPEPLRDARQRRRARHRLHSTPPTAPTTPTPTPTPHHTHHTPTFDMIDLRTSRADRRPPEHEPLRPGSRDPLVLDSTHPRATNAAAVIAYQPLTQPQPDLSPDVRPDSRPGAAPARTGTITPTCLDDDRTTGGTLRRPPGVLAA